jgi:hypothetical protein
MTIDAATEQNVKELRALILKNILNFRDYRDSRRDLIIEILEKFEKIETAKKADSNVIAALETLFRAMEIDDRILTADIIEYEILPRLDLYAI